MATETFAPLKGHCTCKIISYECQRETGTAFVLNAIIESYNFRLTSETKPVLVDIPSASGDGQMVARCPKCCIVLYGDYGGNGTWTTFVRAGTLDDEGKKTVKPDAHIFTSTKMEWVDLTREEERGVPVLEKSYCRSEVWRKDALERLDVLKQKTKAAEKADKETKNGNGESKI